MSTMQRVIALFNSWAYVSVNEPSWFSFQSARDFTAIIEDCIFRRVHGHRMPLEFVFRAYLKTMEVFVDMVNVIPLR